MNMSKRLVIILITLSLSCVAIMAQESMPIIAYMGVPNDKTTEANYKDFHDCGFNVSLYGYASLNQLITACRVADKCGVKVLGHCPETHNTPEYAAKQLMKENGFFGYVLEDEPSAPRIKVLQAEIERLKSIDQNHCFYINLNPYYADWILDIVKTKSYKEYVKIGAAASCQQISFDFYPIEKNGVRSGWYNNLEIIRDESLNTGKPFWGFILSVPHCSYPQPTMESLRLQAYVNLAYGAQAIQYFTYWTPEPTKEWDFHNGPISRGGKKTSTYFLVQKFNKELRPIADLFYGAKVKAVNHMGEIPQGAKRLTVVPVNIKSIKVEGANGAIVSQFTKDGHSYMAVVNKDYNKALTLSIRTRHGVKRIKKDMTTEKPQERYTIEAGDMLLFKLK